MKYFIFFLILLLISCSKFNRNYFPKGVEINHIENYACWPYDVDVYSVNKLDYDSLFFKYPLNDICSSDCKLVKWSKYDSVSVEGLSKFSNTLSQCEDSLSLLESIEQGNTLYYSGCYKVLKLKNGKSKRIFNNVTFFDEKSLKVFSFENINYHR